MMSVEATIPAQASGARSRTAWRIAAIVVFLGVPLAAAGLAGSAVMTALDATTMADHAESTALAIIHQLDHRATPAQAPVNTSPLYLASPNASLARAELQALAGRVLEGAGGRVIEMQSQDAAEPDPANHVTVDVTFDATNRSLLDILFATEAGLPLLTVPKLEIRDQAADDAASQSGGLLRITMTLEGTWKAASP